jgi:hypothetical protein
MIDGLLLSMHFLRSCLSVCTFVFDVQHFNKTKCLVGGIWKFSVGNSINLIVELDVHDAHPLHPCNSFP